MKKMLFLGAALMVFVSALVAGGHGDPVGDKLASEGGAGVRGGRIAEGGSHTNGLNSEGGHVGGFQDDGSGTSGFYESGSGSHGISFQGGDKGGNG